MGEYIDEYEFILDLIDDYMDVCDAVECHEMNRSDLSGNVEKVPEE